MALSMAQIMPVAGRAIIAEMGRNYFVGDVFEGPNQNSYTMRVYDTNSWHYVTIVWTREDELRQTREAQRIDFAKCMLEDAIEELDHAIAGRVGRQVVVGLPPDLLANIDDKADPPIDVDFS